MTFTGRSRTLTFSATFAGSVELTILDPQGDTDDQGFRAPFTVSTGLGEAVCYFRATWDRTTAPIFQDTEAEINLRFPWGVVLSYSDVNRTTGNTSRAISGGYSFSATVYEAFEVYPLPDNDGDGFPTYGGAAAKDGTPGLGVRYVEVVKYGDPVTISVDFGSGYSFTATEPAVGDWVVPAYFRYYDWFPALGLNELDAITAAWTITHTGEPTDVTFSASDSWTNGAGSSATLSYTADVVSCSLAVAGPDWAAAEGIVLGIVGPPTEYAVRARATGFGAGLGAAIPASLKRDSGPPLAISLPSGSDYTATHVQRDYDITLRANVNPGVTQTLRGRAPVQLWLQPPFGTDDDPLDWRCQALGTRWLSGTVSHAAATVRDDGSSTAGWTAGANTTVTSVGGAIKLAVAGGAGSATRTFSPEQSSEAYRYLRVRVRSTVGDGQPLTLSLEDGDPARTKTWSFQTGAAGTYVNVDIDLCRPQNETATTDGQSSRYPLTAAEGTGKPKGSEPYWGGNRLAALTFGSLTDGETYEFDYVESVRVANPRLWVSPSFEPFRDGWPGTTVKPALWSHVEGRTADVYAQRKDGTSYVQTTVSDLWARLVGLGGWSVTEGPGHSDGYHSNARDALYLGGLGTTWSGSGWEDWHDLEVAGSTQVYAAALWDAVEVYPGAGDVWTGTASYGGATPVRYSKRLRHYAHGLVYDGLLPDPGQVVEWRRTDATEARGTGTTAASGTYSTGTPWGYGSRDHAAVLLAGLTSVPKPVAANRSRPRACFVAPATTVGSIHSSTQHDGGDTRVYTVIVASDGAVTLWRYRVPGDDATFPVLGAGSATTAQVGCKPDGSVAVVYSLAGVTSLRESYDSGETWGAAVSVGSGTVPAYAVDPGTGSEFVVLHNGTSFVCRRRYRGGSWATAGTVVTAAEASGGLEVQPDVTGRLVFVVAVSGVVRRYVSFDDGDTWAEE